MANFFSVIALVLSFAAVCFSGLQWREAHSQLLLSMKPSITLSTDADPDELPVGISVENAGPGPATIKSVTYFVDRKLTKNLEQVIDLADLSEVHYTDLDPGDTLAVGEKEWILKYATKPRTKAEEKKLEELSASIDQHVAVRIEFCPVLPGECGKKCSKEGWCD